MARGNLPAQTPQVPRDSFVAFDLLYRHVTDLSADLKALEGAGPPLGPGLVSDTSLDFDTAMSTSLKPNQKIRFEFWLFATSNVKFRLLGPASPALVLWDQTGSAQIAYSGSDIVTASPTFFQLRGIVHNGTTAGTFGISWAQNVSSVTPAGFYQGSVFRYSSIA
jgi:hypothetical protein